VTVSYLLQIKKLKLQKHMQYRYQGKQWISPYL